MLVLGIETSCDETAAAVLDVKEDGRASILSETVSSQIEIHQAYGGVVPEIASRAHLQNLPLVVDEVFSKSQIKISELDLISVTRGPGLKGCLLMGVHFAQAMSIAAKIPLIGVNHIEGHIAAARLDNHELKYPFLALVVSGGHTELLEVHAGLKYRLLARTTDDAAGEAFDKSANLLGFPYPGGPALAKLADEHGRSSFRLPKVMRAKTGFSFSGLKTAISLLVSQNEERLKNEPGLKADLAAAVQDSIVEALCGKVQDCLAETTIRELNVCGGVSANKALRERLKAIKGLKVYFPNFNHCMDNGAMIAYIGAERFRQGLMPKEEELEVLARWPVEAVSTEAVTVR